MHKLFLYAEAALAPAVENSWTEALQILQPLIHAQPASGVQDGLSGAAAASATVPDNIDQVVVLDERGYNELMASARAGGKLLAKQGPESFASSEYASVYHPYDVLVSYDSKGAGLTVLSQVQMKPLILDFELVSYRQRLLRGGRQKEAVARAVMSGLEDGACVFDATAGLGRESMILAHAGAAVTAFERQLPVWLILRDALNRAQGSRYFPFALPVLHSRGTIKDYAGDLRPEVIYYDPMFPERGGSAQVKKDMFVFQQVIGEDRDTELFLEAALNMAVRRVVVKRPSYAPPVTAAGIERSYFVDGGQCRFDCYSISELSAQQ